MSILYQGVIVVDPLEDPPNTLCDGAFVDAREDVYPGSLIALQAIFGTIWWILQMFVYVKNSADLKGSNG